MPASLAQCSTFLDGGMVRTNSSFIYSDGYGSASCKYNVSHVTVKVMIPGDSGTYYCDICSSGSLGIAKTMYMPIHFCSSVYVEVQYGELVEEFVEPFCV